MMSAVTSLGCQLGYITKNSIEQLRIINGQVPIEKALQDPRLSEEEKRKLQLAWDARNFALERIHVSPTKNYSGYKHLDRPFVSYVLSASEKWELKPNIWSYPIVGQMPYKGYFDEEAAKKEKIALEKKNLDVYLRGVSAYSTLGWFRDPVLSSMLRGKDHDLVNTIIHEMTHTTLYIKNNADFNERMAVFVGNKATEEFYLDKEGPKSPTVQLIKNENEDDAIFSKFISQEIESLKNWYSQLPPEQRGEEIKARRLKEIQERFDKDILPKMKSASYKRFSSIELNNARILVYRTYMSDLSDFEKLFKKLNSNWPQFFEVLKGMQKSKDPEKELKDYLGI